MVVLTEHNIDKFVWVNNRNTLRYKDGHNLKYLSYYKWEDQGFSATAYIGLRREVVMPKCLIQW